MSDRTPLVAANWKMNKTIEEAERFLAEFLPRSGDGSVEVFICPPFPALKSVVEHCVGSRVRVAAQNMHHEDSGAFTGEVAAPMLVELGVAGVILGHSERRQHFRETDEALERKVPAALAAGLLPILCVGESETQRQSGDTLDILRAQLTRDLAAVEEASLARVVVAYEPIWAIGTGKTATPQQAEEAMGAIRDVVAERDRGAAEGMRILYGGSVKPDNARELAEQPSIDGALVGGASLDAGDFAEIVSASSTG